jgi:PKD repeat protein
MTDSTIFTDASLLNLYKGNGTVNLTAYTSTQFSASIPTGNDTMAIQTTAIDTAILIYYYCIPSTSSTTNISICASAMPYNWNNNAYTSAGSYTVTLTNYKGGDSIATLNLTVKPISVSTTNYTVCANTLPYIWNSQTFNSAGTYTVHLTNSVGCDSAATLILTVNSGPVVSPINGVTSVLTGQTITLTDATTGGNWASQSKGTATIDNNGVVTGVAVGTDTITYSLSNSCGITVVKYAVYVNKPATDKCNNLTAGFTLNQLNQCITGNNYVFTNTTTGGTGPFVYNWDFNDGNHSSVMNPVHVYSQPSDHDISLTVTDANGCQSGYLVQITVGPEPIPSFNTAFNTYNGSGTTFNSTSTIAAGNMTYYWNLGNGTSSTLINPMVVYNPGTYLVTLVVTGSGGCVDSVKELVNVKNNTLTIIGNVGLINGQDSVCKGAAIQLSDTTKTGIWSSLNTAVATVSGTGLVTGLSAGNVQINYTVTNSYGVFTANKIITVTGPPATPVISGNTNICLGTDASFTANSTGGVWSSTNTNVATVNTSGLVSGLTAGTSDISYSMNNGCGVTSATSTVTVAKCAPCTLPVVAAINGQTQVTPGATIQLSDNTANGVWASGNTAIVTVDNTGKITGIAAGSTTVTYTVTNSCGSTVSSVTITCSSASVPPTVCTLAAKFKVNNLAQCVTDNKFIFTDESTGGNGTLVYNWDFNDGNHSTDQNPVHVYASAADHDVSVTVTDGNFDKRIKER